MRLAILIAFLFGSSFMEEKEFYRMSLDGLNGEKIRMSDFYGKRILIFEFDPTVPGQKIMYQMDSVQRLLNEEIVVIGVPAKEFMSEDSFIEELKSFQNSVSSNYHFSNAVNVSNRNVGEQSELFSWLSTASKYNPVPLNVTEPGNIYIIDEKGSVYASMQGFVAVKNILLVIERKPLVTD